LVILVHGVYSCVFFLICRWDTLKLEEIYGSLYSVQCDILYRRKHDRGTPRPLLEKFCSGLLLFLLLLVIVFGPLLLFSTANPVSQSNPVSAAAIGLSLTSGFGEYPLISISSYVLSSISSDQYVTLRNKNLLDDADRLDSVQSVAMSSFSDFTWDISPPSLSMLRQTLNDPAQRMSMKFTYEFTRAAGPQNTKSIQGTIVTPLSQDLQSQLAIILNANSSQMTGHSSQMKAHQDMAGVEPQSAWTTQPEDRLMRPAQSSFHALDRERHLERRWRQQQDVRLRQPFTYYSNSSAHPSNAFSSPYTSSPHLLSPPPHWNPAPSLRLASSSSVRIPQIVPIYLRLPATSDPIELASQTDRSDIVLTLDIAHADVGAPIGQFNNSEHSQQNIGQQMHGSLFNSLRMSHH
jgi:hypothetical protein